MSWSGFSLIPVAVSTALGIGLVYTLTELSGMQRKVMMTTEAGLDTLDLVNQIRGILAEPESCKRTFAGTGLTLGEVEKVTRAFRAPGQEAWQYADAYKVNQLTGSVKIKAIRFKGSDTVPFDGNGFAELEIERTKKAVMGSPAIVRQIPLRVVPDHSTGSVVAECYAITGNPSNTTTDKPGGLDASMIDTSSVATCGAGSRFRLALVAGKVRVECTPCTQQKVFTHSRCEVSAPGRGYINACYYKIVCSEDPNALILPEARDPAPGPSTVTGESGSEAECLQKRKKCLMEP
jgi:hypothetical protein